MDTNNRYSYACLQFQEATFNSYSKRYGLEGDIYTCADQKIVARKMIEENPNNWRHWYTSVAKRGLGKPPVI